MVSLIKTYDVLFVFWSNRVSTPFLKYYHFFSFYVTACDLEQSSSSLMYDFILQTVVNNSPAIHRELCSAFHTSQPSSVQGHDPTRHRPQYHSLHANAIIIIWHKIQQPHRDLRDQLRLQRTELNQQRISKGTVPRHRRNRPIVLKGITVINTECASTCATWPLFQGRCPGVPILRSVFTVFPMMDLEVDQSQISSRRYVHPYE